MAAIERADRKYLGLARPLRDKATSPGQEPSLPLELLRDYRYKQLCAHLYDFDLNLHLNNIWKFCCGTAEPLFEMPRAWIEPLDMPVERVVSQGAYITFAPPDLPRAHFKILFFWDEKVRISIINAEGTIIRADDLQHLSILLNEILKLREKDYFMRYKPESFVF